MKTVDEMVRAQGQGKETGAKGNCSLYSSCTLFTLSASVSVTLTHRDTYTERELEHHDIPVNGWVTKKKEISLLKNGESILAPYSNSTGTNQGICVINLLSAYVGEVKFWKGEVLAVVRFL